MKIYQDQDNKCAPSKKYENGSCFTLDNLLKMSYSYNQYIDNGKIKNKKINIIKDKKYLLKELTYRLDNICKDQLCWLKQDFVKKIRDPDISKNTFRPRGPQGKFEWLNTLHINDVMEQYENKYPEFKFLGSVPIDFDIKKLEFLGIRNLNLNNMYNKGKTKLGFVFNLDEHYKTGSHWVALFCDIKNKKIFYFDSVGSRPEKRIRKLIKRITTWCIKNDCNDCSISCSESFMMPNKKNKLEEKLDIEYNHNKHQYKDSECGVYSMNFILRLLNGESFNEIVNKRTNDDKMNLCRDVYFTLDKPFNELK